MNGIYRFGLAIVTFFTLFAAACNGASSVSTAPILSPTIFSSLSQQEMTDYQQLSSLTTYSADDADKLLALSAKLNTTNKSLSDDECQSLLITYLAIFRMYSDPNLAQYKERAKQRMDEIAKEMKEGGCGNVGTIEVSGAK